MKPLFLILCLTLTSAQFPQYDTGLYPPQLPPDQNVTDADSTVPQFPAEEQNYFPNDGQPQQQGYVPEGLNSSPEALPGVNVNTEPQFGQPNPYIGDQQPGLSAQSPLSEALPESVSENATSSPWTNSSSEAASPESMSAIFSNSNDTFFANGNVTAGNSTISPPFQDTTTSGSFNPWQSFKDWWFGNNKNNDDDDDYYDGGDYYDDDYYNDDGLSNSTNKTDSLFDWLEEEFNTTTVEPLSDITTIPTEFSTTPSPCPLESVTLGLACSSVDILPGVGDLQLTLKDVAEQLFDEAVVNDLILECPAGQWCLKDSRFFNPLKMDTSSLFCNYTDCLSDYADQCNTEERTLVTSSLRALCAMSKVNMSETCSLQVNMLLHVAYADLRRSQLNPGTEDVCGIQNESSGDCGNGKTSCRSVAESFSCLADHCLTDELRSIWSRVPFWQWYFWDPLYMKEMCQITNDTTNCNYVLPTPEPAQYTFLVTLDQMDTKLMTGVATAMVVALAGFVVAVWACVKRFSGGYTREKVQYAEIRNVNFDSV